VKGRKRMRRMAFRSLLGLFIVVACLAASSTAAAKEKPVYYLALGDSLAIGAQPTAVNVDGSTEEGYADQLAEMLTAENPDLRLVKLGWPCCVSPSSGRPELLVFRGSPLRSPWPVG
jgi:hypothetical protein